MTDAAEIRFTCPYCGVGCGVLLRADRRGGLSVRGDPDHPANQGMLCSKGSALSETVGPEGRLLAPRICGVETARPGALDLVASRFRDTLVTPGRGSAAFYVTHPRRPPMRSGPAATGRPPERDRR